MEIHPAAHKELGERGGKCSSTSSWNPRRPLVLQTINKLSDVRGDWIQNIYYPDTPQGTKHNSKQLRIQG